jgi:hypothetical protein
MSSPVFAAQARAVSRLGVTSAFMAENLLIPEMYRPCWLTKG